LSMCFELEPQDYTDLDYYVIKNYWLFTAKLCSLIAGAIDCFAIEN